MLRTKGKVIRKYLPYLFQYFGHPSCLFLDVPNLISDSLTVMIAELVSLQAATMRLLPFSSCESVFACVCVTEEKHIHSNTNCDSETTTKVVLKCQQVFVTMFVILCVGRF